MLRLGYRPGRLTVNIARAQQRTIEEWARRGFAVCGADGLLVILPDNVVHTFHSWKQPRGEVRRVVAQHGHVIDEALGGLEYRFEHWRALGQVTHGADGLVPDRHLPRATHGLWDLTQGAGLERCNPRTTEHDVAIIWGKIPVVAGDTFDLFSAEGHETDQTELAVLHAHAA